MLLVLIAALFMQSVGQTQPQSTPGPSSPIGPIADVNGPGQSVVRPAPQCPRTISCTYAERTFLPDGYRVQSLEVCGADCTTQYWVSASTDGQQLLALDPVRGGAAVAVGQSKDRHPPVRVIEPNYAASDPACCPSGFADTTYTWDGAVNTLAAGQPMITPRSLADKPVFSPSRSRPDFCDSLLGARQAISRLITGFSAALLALTFRGGMPSARG
jgi:hypothetical protein